MSRLIIKIRNYIGRVFINIGRKVSCIHIADQRVHTYNIVYTVNKASNIKKYQGKVTIPATDVQHFEMAYGKPFNKKCILALNAIDKLKRSLADSIIDNHITVEEITDKYNGEISYYAYVNVFDDLSYNNVISNMIPGIDILKNNEATELIDKLHRYKGRLKTEGIEVEYKDYKDFKEEIKEQTNNFKERI